MAQETSATGISVLAAVLFVVLTVGARATCKLGNGYDESGVALIRHFSATKTAFLLR